jgi:TPR repeat protein
VKILRVGQTLLLALAFGISFSSIAETSADAQAAYGRGDYPAAVRIWQELAAQGSDEARTWLGLMYARGHGVPQDDQKAVRWYRDAAEQGYPWGQTNLGYMYASGRGVARDDEEAVRLYRSAAEKDFPMAQDNLGVMYRDGRGVKRDPLLAAYWFRRAAENGYAEGQNNLGSLYATGRGVVRNDGEAVMWFRKAAEQGSAIAQTNLGVMFRDGRGVARDPALAAQWLGKAAAQGDTRAQELLGAVDRQARDVAQRKAAILATIEKHETAQILSPAADAARSALAREVIAATGLREKLATTQENIKRTMDDYEAGPDDSPQLVDAARTTAQIAFRADRVLSAFERELAEALDAATLQVGLQWEHSDLGRKINRLELEAAAPTRHAAYEEFARQFIAKDGTASDARARACSQRAALDDSTEVLLPLLEAMLAGQGMMASVQRRQPVDLDAIQRNVVGMRPLLRDAARQATLASCLFSFGGLIDEEFDLWLEFLRTDAGGRYVRGVHSALRKALLQVAEVYVRTIVDVARQLKGTGGA